MSCKKKKSAKKTLDRDIWDWYCETCSINGKKVSKNSLQARAKWVFHEAGILDFKASDGWYRRFIQRWRDLEPNSEPVSKPGDSGNIQTPSDSSGHVDSTTNQVLLKEANPNEATASISARLPKVKEFAENEPAAEVYTGEIIDCLSKFIDTSELSQTSMDFFYDSEDSSFSTTRNALLLAETEQLSEGTKARHRKRGERYLPKFKEKVLSFVTRNRSIKKAAAKFKIHGTTISNWRREQGKHEAVVAGTVSKETVPADQQLITWLRRCRERGVTVSADTLAGKAAELAGEEGSPRWLVMWANRLGETDRSVKGALVPAASSERNVRYPDAFKAEVAAFAEAHSQVAASKLFAVSRRRVFDWLQALRQEQNKGASTGKQRIVEAKLEASSQIVSDLTGASPDPDPRVGSSLGVGAKDTTSSGGADLVRSRVARKEVDDAVWTWFQGQTVRPSSKQVCAKGAELYALRGLGIKCSLGWYRRWCNRHGVKQRFYADDRLLQWTLTRLEANKCVSHHDLQVQAMRLLSNRKPDFKASAGWALRFCRRHPALLRSVPTLETPLPSHLAARVTRFRQSMQGLIHDGGLPFASVGNVDELQLCFGVDPDQPEPWKPLLRRPSVADCHATVVLACLADGSLLAPTIILKANANAACAGATFHPSAALDVDAMLRWLPEVWAPAVGSRSLLLADAFPAHSAPSVREAALALGTDLRIVPGGCTSKLQPLTVAVVDRVKAQVMMRWQAHNASAQSPWQPGLKVKVPEPAQIVTWVNEACVEVRRTQQETIRRSFLVTGITVAANGSEDHFVENASMIPISADSKQAVSRD